MKIMASDKLEDVYVRFEELNIIYPESVSCLKATW